MAGLTAWQYLIELGHDAPNPFQPVPHRPVPLGTGKTDDSGKKVPFEVKKGDRVLVSKYGGTEIKLDGKEYKILNTDDILAVIE